MGLASLHVIEAENGDVHVWNMTSKQEKLYIGGIGDAWYSRKLDR